MKMKKICDWWEDVEFICEHFLTCIVLLFFILFLPIAAGVLISIATSLGKIERDFSTVQQLQQEVKHLTLITNCLEPARPVADPTLEQHPDLPTE